MFLPISQETVKPLNGIGLDAGTNKEQGQASNIAVDNTPDTSFDMTTQIPSPGFGDTRPPADNGSMEKPEKKSRIDSAGKCQASESKTSNQDSIPPPLVIKLFSRREPAAYWYSLDDEIRKLQVKIPKQPKKWTPPPKTPHVQSTSPIWEGKAV